MSGGPIEKGEVFLGDYIRLQASHLPDALSVEWFGNTAYPVIHSGGACRVVPQPTATTNAPKITSGPLYIDRCAYSIQAETPSTSSESRQLTYGMTVRLLNVYSNSYLCSRDNGEVEAVLLHPRDVKECVDETNVRRDLWKLLPRHKVREDGECVKKNDQLFLVNIACGLYLNSGQPSTALQNWANINNDILKERGLEPPTRAIAGFQGTDSRGAAWMVVAFDSLKGLPANTRNAIRCLDTVVIFHKEVEGFLTANKTSTDGTSDVFFDQCKVGKSTYNVLDLKYTTGSLFTIECEDPTTGGPTHYGKKRYRLKHAATDTYLTVNIVEGEGGKRIHKITTTPNPDDLNSIVIFQVLDSDNAEPYLTRNGFTRIQFAKSEVWLHGNTEIADSQSYLQREGDIPSTMVKKEKEIPSQHIKAEVVSKGYFEDVLAIRVVRPTLRADLLSVATTSVVVKEYIKHWQTKKIVKPEDEDWRGRRRVTEVDHTEVAKERMLTQETSTFFQVLIRALSNMSFGCKDMNLLEGNLPQPSLWVQRMFFDINIHELLFKALQLPLEVGGLSLEVISKVPEGEALLQVYQLGFRLVEQMIKGAKDLGVKLSKFIPFLEAQLKHELNIASALMQIVVDNIEILESLHQRQLEGFCFLIPQYGRVPTYLTLLSACCVCEGEAVPANQTVIARCFSGMSGEQESDQKPCSVASLRVFYKITIHALDGLHIKSYSTFPPSAERRVERFLKRYEADRVARQYNLLSDNCDLSSSESSLSSADTDEEDVTGLHDDDVDVDFEEEIDQNNENDVSDAILSQMTSTRSYLYRAKKSSKASWGNFVTESATGAAATAGCYVWRCELPSVSMKWYRQWFSIISGYLTFRKEKGGGVVRSLPVVEILNVTKSNIVSSKPPEHVRTFGINCELNTGGTARLLICAECIGDRNELLTALQTEVRNAEAAIEGTKALSGDLVFAGRVGNQGNKKTASLQSHMKSLLHKRGTLDTSDEANTSHDRLRRVSVGNRFDTQWEPLGSFIKHRPLQSVSYLEAQLVLMRKLCTGGNELSLRWVQQQLSRDVIKEGITLNCDHYLTPGIRSVFTDLAITVYLLPFGAESSSSRHQTFLSQLRCAVDDQLRRPASRLKQGQKGELFVLNEQRFTSAILRLCDHLISIRSYSNSELSSLLPPLLKTLSRHPPQTNNQPTGIAADSRRGRHKNQLFQQSEEELMPTFTRKDRTEVSELQKKIMETKLEACNVLMRLFSDLKTSRILTSVFGSFVSKGEPDQLTSALLSVVLHEGHNLLFITAIKLLFRNLSTDSSIESDLDPEAHSRLAEILKRQLETDQPQVILSLFRLLDGGFEGVEDIESITLGVMRTLTRMIYLDTNVVAMAQVQTKLDRLGLAPLVAILIESKSELVVYHSLVLMIALMTNGNVEVQDSLSHYFLSRNDEALFVTLRNRISAAVQLVREVGSSGQIAQTKSGSSKSESNYHHIREVLRVLQLFSEGHNITMQDYLRSQLDNVVSYNLVKESFTFLCVFLTIHNHNSFTQSILVQAFNALTEFCQGPCKGNQHQLIKGNIAVQLNGVLARTFDGLSKEQVNEIRSAVILCIHSVLEGATHNDQFALAVARTVDERVLKTTLEECWLDRKTESSLEVCFNIYVLLKMLRLQRAVEGCPGYSFLDAMTGGIEICRDGKLERVYFRIPSISTNLSQETKDELLRTVNRSTPTARISDFYYRAEGLIFEIEYYQKMFHQKRDGTIAESSRLVQQFLHRNSTLWHDAMIIIAFAANIIFLSSAAYQTDGVTIIIHEDMKSLLDFLSISEVLITICLLSDFLISKAPLISFRIQKLERLEGVRNASRKLSARQMITWWNSPEADDPMALPPNSAGGTTLSKERKPTENSDETSDDDVSEERLPIRRREAADQQHGSDISKVLNDQSISFAAMIWSFRDDTMFLFYTSCFLFAVVALFWSPFFLSVHLLAICTRSPVLINVLTAATRHNRVLVLSALLGSVIVYLFTVVAFILFRDKFRPEFEDSDTDGKACDTLSGCFRYLLINAVRAGGGVGDLIQDHAWNDRPYIVFGILSDFLFFVIVIVILLNIISGVIIDTFARLREERQSVEDDIRSKCFICGIESTQFDRQAEGFETHTKQDHNLWLYIYFLHHLMKKDASEFTGQESYVHSMIQRHDLAFFPLNKAIILEGKRDEEDRLINIGNEDRAVQDKLSEVEGRLGEVCYRNFFFFSMLI